MKRFLLLVALIGSWPAPVAAQTEWSSPDFWRRSFGLADPSRPLVSRSRAVFERMREVVDERVRRLPQLLIIEGPDHPEARALPDGTLVLNHAMIELCYRLDRGTKDDLRSVEQKAIGDEPGDSRLAHVIGHELAHLIQDDFLHEEQYAIARRFAYGDGRDELLASAGAYLESMPERELVADRLGLQYLLMAGFDSRPLFVPEQFLVTLHERALGLGANIDLENGGRLPLAARLQVLRTELQRLMRSFDLFRWGTRLLELGSFRDAGSLLQIYREILPSREVLNNLGLVQFQLAAQSLAECDGRLVVRYRLPLVVDPRTVESRSRLRGAETSPCLREPVYRQQIEEAQRYLEAARRSSRSYLAARLNLASAYLLDEQSAQAVAVAQEAAEIAPDDPLARLVRELSHYLFLEHDFQRDGAADAALQAIEELITDSSGPIPEALYAKASIELARGRNAVAVQTLERFLEVEPRGPWADAARERLGREVLDEPAGSMANLPRPPPPPIEVGPITDRSERQLVNYDVERYRLGALEFAHYRGERVRALVINDVIEAVEHEMSGEGISLSRGIPDAVVRSANGEILRYPGFALEVQEGRVRYVVHYARLGGVDSDHER
jgi:tetratricopeptide (TPR) repeat protein